MKAIVMAKGRPPGADPDAQLYLVTFTIPCPVCDTKWRFQFRQHMKAPEELDGAYRVQIDEAWIWKVDSSRWGCHGLCGECRANRKAKLIIRRPGQNPEAREAWTEADEAMMKGRQKHQQEIYAAAVRFHVEDDPFRELIDEQKSRMLEILPVGRNTIFMSMQNR